MNKNALQSLEIDVDVASMTVHKYGHLTPAVQYSLEKWFADVSTDIIFPMTEMPLDDAERSSLMALAIDDMLSAIRSVKEKNLDDQESFAILAPILDPLWRELSGILAPNLNEAWQTIRPKDHYDLEQRIAFIENMLGTSRDELYNRSLVDLKLRAFISKLGLTPDELK